MGGGESGDLWHVGNGHHLVGTSEIGQFTPHTGSDFSADIGVDLVEHEQGNGVLASEGAFDGQHDA